MSNELKFGEMTSWYFTRVSDAIELAIKDGLEVDKMTIGDALDYLERKENENSSRSSDI